MNLWPAASATTWDAAPAAPQLSEVREGRVVYDVHARSSLDYARVLPILMQGTTSADVRLYPGEGDAPLWAATALDICPDRWEFFRPPLTIRPRPAEARGPLGGRLISWAEACRLADEALLTAESERQAAREREAHYWRDLEDEP